MLRGTVAFLALVAFALLGSELRKVLAGRGIRAPALESFAFLAVGFALGERGFGFLPTDLLANLQPVVLCSTPVRLAFKKLADRFIPNLFVLSYEEILNTVEVRSLGNVELSDAD